MTKPLWTLLSLLALAPAAAACDLPCSVERALGEEGIAGAVYSVVDGDDISTGAAGFSNYPARQTMRADSKVHVGSVTKTMLALGVLRLATQGRVDLDAPIGELLPRTPIDNPWHARSPVTLRHLLDHTSGLEDLRLWHLFTLEAEPDAPLSVAFTRRPEILRARFEPGTHFSYSNMGYTLAGMVIEAVTGERYEAWLDHELLAPLGMTDSTFAFVSQSGPHADARLAWGHYEDFSLAGANAIWVRPPAQFTTTAADMANAARFLMGDGRVGGEIFIDESLLRQMGRGRTAAEAGGLEAGYALGIQTRDRHGAVGLCHTGNIVGYRAAFCLFREQRKAFFIAQNTDSETARYARFDELMIRALGVSSPVVRTIGPHEVPTKWLGRYAVSPARFESFRYFDYLFDSVTVGISEGGLELRRAGDESRILVPVGRNLYRAADRTRASHVLLTDGTEMLISEGTRTMRKTSEAGFLMSWGSLVLGVAGLFMLMVLIPWRAWRRGEPLLQPASLALLLLLATVPLFALQPFMALGDITAASLCLYVASLGLPPLMLAQILWAWQARGRVKSWRVHAVAATLVLQWCASLYAWDLLPFALWE